MHVCMCVYVYACIYMCVCVFTQLHMFQTKWGQDSTYIWMCVKYIHYVLVYARACVCKICCCYVYEAIIDRVHT